MFTEFLTKHRSYHAPVLYELVDILKSASNVIVTDGNVVVTDCVCLR